MLDVSSMLANLGSGSLFAQLSQLFCQWKSIALLSKISRSKCLMVYPPEVTSLLHGIDSPGSDSLVLFWVIRHIIGFDINGFLSNLLMPLKDVLAGNSLFGGLLTVFLICFFWVLEFMDQQSWVR